MKTSVYLPDDLAAVAKGYGIRVSQVAQEALREAIAQAERQDEAGEGASGNDGRPVWELQPSDPAMAQCGECFALVLRAALGAHGYWHDKLNGREV